MTNLRKKNFDFRSKITELEDKAKHDVNASGRAGSRNPRPERERRHGGEGRMGAGGPGAETANEIALAMHM